ncbi:hypothetical protein COU59_01420 [Candidatus Pacearchaeota archaeon CG10_big_fil_rev_8_21_14_0_10_34_12]|nr:MAG: hypothetical protein COU59_01420 [Candidatus Pacearchaeota archaeon CG10_big_fil_rev_8_21_14_0_10_34_12]
MMVYEFTKEEMIDKITQKKEFSQLPEKDVETAFEKFDKERNSDYQKLKLTRNFLREIFSSFSSRKLLNPMKEKGTDWYLMKHKSTKERFPYYEEVYGRIFKDFKDKEISLIDLGAGINGFSYGFFKKINLKVKYVGVEAVGQLVKLMNLFFKENKIKGKSSHLSLFETGKIKELIKKQKKPRIIFFMKVIDSLEAVERDYSKKLLREIIPLSNIIVLSFATRSLGSGKKFGVNRNWILKFIKDVFQVLDDFEIGGERYVIFKERG